MTSLHLPGTILHLGLVERVSELWRHAKHVPDREVNLGPSAYEAGAVTVQPSRLTSTILGTDIVCSLDDDHELYAYFHCLCPEINFRLERIKHEPIRHRA